MNTPIRILTLGGTIDKTYFDAASRYEVGPPQVERTLLTAGVCFDYVLESLMRKDSLAMDDRDRQLVAERVCAAPERHILITHGTDSMEQTAEVVRQHCQDKVVVFTGAFHPALFRETDAPFNIGCAVGALLASAPGVYIVMNGAIFSAGTVQKNREAGRFEQVAS